jgi:hypothetical protein
MNFSEARYHSEIIFQILGDFCKKYGLRVNFNETAGQFILDLKNPWTWSTGRGPMVHLGPQWTGAAWALEP